jgi:hypothetical protein
MQARDQNACAGLWLFRAQAREAADELTPQLHARHLRVQCILGAQRLPIEWVLEHQAVQGRTRDPELHEGFGQVAQTGALGERGVETLGQPFVAALHDHEEQAVQRAEVVVDVARGTAEQRADASRRELCA